MHEASFVKRFILDVRRVTVNATFDTQRWNGGTVSTGSALYDVDINHRVIRLR